MNVLFYRYNSICEPMYINALKALDINVIEETTEMTQKNISPQMVFENVRAILERTPVMFVMSINYYPIISALCNISHIPYVSMIVDSPVLELYSDTIRNPYNRIFIFDKALYNRHMADNPDCIFHMPLCADIQTIEKALSGQQTETSKYACDISFIGSLYTEKCPYNHVKNLPPYMRGYFDGLIQSQLQVYGANFIYECLTDEMVAEFKKYEKMYTFPEKARKDEKAVLAYQYLGIKVSELDRITSLKRISDRYPLDLYTGSDTSCIPHVKNKGFAKSLTEMPLIFSNSKINLQITARTIETGLSQRVWDVLGAGGFLLMNYQEELFDYFEPGVDLDYWGSQDEMMDKIDFYLRNDNIRNKIAQNGHEKALKYHSSITRLTSILKKI